MPPSTTGPGGGKVSLISLPYLVPGAGPGPGTGLSTNEQSKDYFFVILSAAKNLSFKAAEILHSAALRSE